MYDQSMTVVFALALAILLSHQNEPVDQGKAWLGTTAKFEVLKDERGMDVDLSKEYGKRPVVLVFYRGMW